MYWCSVCSKIALDGKMKEQTASYSTAKENCSVSKLTQIKDLFLVFFSHTGWETAHFYMLAY